MVPSRSSIVLTYSIQGSEPSFPRRSALSARFGRLVRRIDCRNRLRTSEIGSKPNLKFSRLEQIWLFCKPFSPRRVEKEGKEAVVVVMVVVVVDCVGVRTQPVVQVFHSLGSVLERPGEEIHYYIALTSCSNTKSTTKPIFVGLSTPNFLC